MLQESRTVIFEKCPKEFDDEFGNLFRPYAFSCTMETIQNERIRVDNCGLEKKMYVIDWALTSQIRKTLECNGYKIIGTDRAMKKGEYIVGW